MLSTRAHDACLVHKAALHVSIPVDTFPWDQSFLNNTLEDAEHMYKTFH